MDWFKRQVRKCSRAKLLWLVRTNVQSWVLQGVLVGLMSVVGVSAVASVVTAKVAAWVFFLGQCAHAAVSSSPGVTPPQLPPQA